MRTRPVVLLAAGAWMTHLAAQTPAPAAIALTGTVVADDASATPLGGAIVRLSGDARGDIVGAITDVMGHFRFDDVPAGRLVVTASKAPYLTMAAGASQPGRSGVPIAVLPGQHVNPIVIRLPRGAVIAGHIRTSSGEDVPNADVYCVAVGLDAAPSSHTTTDDRGAYRFFGLMPGSYLVAAGGDRSAAAIAVLSATDVDRRFAELASHTAAPAPSTSGPETEVFASAPTFFPGVPSPQLATAIAVKAGDESSADFVIGLARSGSLAGTLQTIDGSPLPPVSIQIDQPGPKLPAVLDMQPRVVNNPSASNDAFRVTGVLPGSYTLSAQGRTGSGSTVQVWWANLPVVSTGSDLAGLVVVLRPAIHIRGRVVLDGSANPLPKLPPVRLILTASDGSGAPARPGLVPRAGPIAADQTFDIGGMVPGGYTIAAASAGDWWLRSAVVNGRDLLDVPLEVSGMEDVTGIVLTWSSRHSEVSGVISSDSSSVPDAVIVVFPADDSLWIPGARRIRSSHPATDGHYAFRDLPAGEYLLAGATDISPTDLASHEFLASLANGAVHVVIRDGETDTQNLRMK